MRQHFKTLNCRIADLELLVVLLLVSPVLLFDAWVPAWAVAVALVAIPVLWLIRWLGHGSPIRATPLDLPILILLLTVPVGVWAAAIKPLSLPQIYRIVLSVGLYYAVTGTLASARRIRLFVGWILIAVPVLASIALLGAQLSDSKFPLLAALYDWIPSSITPFWRPTGLGPNSVAGGLVMLLPLAIGFALGGRQRWLRIACALASLFAGSVLVLTQSRGALVGMVFAVLVMFILSSRWFLLAIPAVIFSGLAAVGMLGAERLGKFVFSSTATSAVASLEGRLEIWTRAIYMIRDFPATGVGLGMFDQVMDLLYPLYMVVPETEIFHPHNVFLSQAVSSGLPGLIGFLALIVLLLAMAVQSINRAQREEAWPLAIGLMGALMAYLAHGVFDSPTSFIRASAILWIIIGLHAALWLHLRESPATKDPVEQVSSF